ncbi:DUF2793 domain-containing protein [Pseudomonas sp. BN415]|uniref:DUF2793 domain-containing protein n=1 Tax=Pseudomonas sp. BN415 TaxID=2567889 RepID=UPI002454085A|nr:DUF2793 domain-containing protein [Pseudomonas sp. BN415]MDH4581366.1 DUF2793 domain-containing protein [Pseudomonas sp. BN415]
MTTKLALTDLANGQANYLNANASFAQLNQLVQAAVLDKDLATPPGSPADEALYIVAASPTGAWSGHAKDLAYWLSSVGTWTFVTPREGMLVHVNDEDAFYKYDGSAWAIFTGGGMANPMTTAGDVIVGGSSGTPQRLAKGTDGQVLKVVSGAIAWAAESGGGGGMTNPMTTEGDLIVGGASGTPTRLAKGADNQILKVVSGALTWAAESGGGGAVSSVNGQTGAVLLAEQNLLINGNFAINQRGYVSATNTTAANQYTLDRWRVVTSGQNLAFSASGLGNQITAPAGGVEQVVEGNNIQGGVYTLSWTGTATATVNGTSISNGGQTSSLTAGSNVTIRFSGGTVSLAKFEKGSVATPFEARPYSLELQLCQRYCVVYTLGSGQGFAIGTSPDTSSAYSWILLPTTMRTSSAAVTVASGLNFYDPTARSGTRAGQLQTPFLLQISLTGSSGLTAGRSGYFAWPSGGAITIDAEI